MIYVMSDLHGMYDKYIEMLKKINFNKNDKLYILGDVVDRGDKSIPLLRYIMNQKNVEMIIGNHEDMMLKSCIDSNRVYHSCWMSNGGVSILQQLENLRISDQHEILNYLKERPLYKIVDKYILVHAGLLAIPLENININDYMNQQDSEYLLWERNDLVYNPIPSDHILSDYTIIFGHTPTVYLNGIKPMQIFKKDNLIGIDCGSCFKGGRLACLRLDDMKEFYV